MGAAMANAKTPPNYQFNITAEKRGHDFFSQIPNFRVLSAYLAECGSEKEEQLNGCALHDLGVLYGDIYLKLLRPAPASEADFLPVEINELLLDLVVGLTPFDKNTKAVLLSFLARVSALLEVVLYQPNKWALVVSHVDNILTNERFSNRLNCLLTHGFDNGGDWL